MGAISLVLGCDLGGVSGGAISQVAGCDLVGVGVRRDQCDLGLCAQSQQLCPLFAI